MDRMFMNDLCWLSSERPACFAAPHAQAGPIKSVCTWRMPVIL
jgi:hypothetical protein